MILEYIKIFGKASRKEIDELLLEKLPDLLILEQKSNKIKNIIAAMARTDKKIINQGTNRKPLWKIRMDNE